MKYASQIDESFERLGFKPRPGQREAVDLILTAFLDEKIQNVILNASTGTGKSIIGAVTAETLTSIKGPAEGRGPDAVKSSISLTATNVLAKQYDNTFHELEKRGRYVMIKGANNYDCEALSTPAEPQNAEACAWYTMLKAGDEFASTMEQHCNQCEYLRIKKRKNLVRHLTTNYSYFFVDRMYTHKFEYRDLLIWDEAHLINDLFSEHNAIYFSTSRINKMKEEIAETVRIIDVEISKILTQVANDCAKKDKINEKNYMSYLVALQKVYAYAQQEGAEQAEEALHSGNMRAYTKFIRFAKKYEGLGCKIGDLFGYKYDHVFEYKEEEKAVSVKPIFVGTMFAALQTASHNLFMSATVSEEFISRTLALDPSKTKFIKLPPTFPKENKEIVFFDPLSLSWKTLQDDRIVNSLCKNVATCVRKHVELGERGIVLTPSFNLQERIVPVIKKIPGYTLFEQRRGEKLADVLDAFKSFKGGPAVLISPSLYEGIDLPGDLSRFQVMVKAPFPSLGDKRMKFILDRHPDIYNIITCMKMVQGAGRSVRSAEDHAVTYVLDQNAQRLFNGGHNIWRDEFLLRFTKFI